MESVESVERREVQYMRNYDYAEKLRNRLAGDATVFLR
jgi:hypothetical protein